MSDMVEYGEIHHLKNLKTVSGIFVLHECGGQTLTTLHERGVQVKYNSTNAKYKLITPPRTRRKACEHKVQVITPPRT